MCWSSVRGLRAWPPPQSQRKPDAASFLSMTIPRPAARSGAATPRTTAPGPALTPRYIASWAQRLSAAHVEILQATRVVDSPAPGVLRLESEAGAIRYRVGPADPGHRRARALSSLSRLDAARRDGSGRTAGYGQIRPAHRRQARGAGRQRPAASRRCRKPLPPRRHHRWHFRAGAATAPSSLCGRTRRPSRKTAGRRPLPHADFVRGHIAQVRG